MSKKIYLFSLVLLAFAFVSCSETEEVSEFSNWRERNEAFMDSLQNVYDTAPNHGDLAYIVPEINNTVKIFYKKKIAKETGDSPLFTDSATVYYRGSYISGRKFDENFSGADPNADFDKPITYYVQGFYGSGNSAVSGWADILQHMKVGERWITYIPWKVAYGSSDYTPLYSSTTIPGYSTLIFDIQLQAVKRD